MHLFCVRVCGLQFLFDNWFVVYPPSSPSTFCSHLMVIGGWLSMNKNNQEWQAPPITKLNLFQKNLFD